MKDYILSLLGASVAVSIFSVILPAGVVKKYALFAASLMLSLTMLSPFLTLISGTVFPDFSAMDVPEYTREEAEADYAGILSEEYRKAIEADLSTFGRAYAFVEKDLSVSRIELYTDAVTEEERTYIERTYSPEVLEVNREENP